MKFQYCVKDNNTTSLNTTYINLSYIAQILNATIEDYCIHIFFLMLYLGKYKYIIYIAPKKIKISFIINSIYI